MGVKSPKLLKKLADNLRAIIEADERNTMAWLSRATGVDKSTLSRFLGGKDFRADPEGNPSLGLLEDFAKGLDIEDPIFLLLETDEAELIRLFRSAKIRGDDGLILKFAKNVCDEHEPPPGSSLKRSN